MLNINKKYKYVFVFIIFCILLFFQIYRLLNIPITWDEGITYVFFVDRFFHQGDFIGGIHSFFLREIGAVANNHILNTFLIGITEKLIGVQYNEVVIRLPIFAFWIIYMFASIRYYIQEKISALAFICLTCCSYVNEYFSISRGYAYSAALILLALIQFRKWCSNKKNRYIVEVFYLLLLAELANTAALLITASFVVLYICICVYQRNIVNMIKKLWLPITIWVILQLLVVKYHFFITINDPSLFNNKTGGIIEMMIELVTMPFPKVLHIYLLILIAFIIIVNVFLIIKKKICIGDYKFCSLLILYFVICFIIVNISRYLSSHAGYPTGRILVISYPMYILALDELVKNSYCWISSVKGKRIVNLVCASLSAVLFAICLVNTKYKESTIQPSAEKFKNVAYDIYYNHNDRDVEYLKTICQDPNGFIYYRKKILYENQYDIYVKNGH